MRHTSNARSSCPAISGPRSRSTPARCRAAIRRMRWTRRSWRRRGRALPRWAETPRPCRMTTSGSGSPSASAASARRRRPAPPKRRRSSSTESRPTNGAFWSGQMPIRSMNWSAGRPSAPTMLISSSSSRTRLAGACRPDIAPTLRFPTGGEVGEGTYLDRPRKAREVHMTEFAGRTAVVTGGGSGMGRELVRQLVAEACNVAMCDVSPTGLAETQRLCEAAGLPQGLRVTTHIVDVADRTQVERFRDEVADRHQTDKIHLLFNNAGIGGGGSMVVNSRDEWERTFNICWGGVYLATRAFLPLLQMADEGHIVNTSCMNGFWASIGPAAPYTAYSAAKFAVKGFTEALIADFRMNAPHIKVSVVMPVHIGTGIRVNSLKVQTNNDSDE